MIIIAVFDLPLGMENVKINAAFWLRYFVFGG